MSVEPVQAGKLPRFVELIRVSSKGQADRDTPEVQRNELDKLRKQRPGVLVERIEDGAAGMSGALPLDQRTDLQRLFVLARAKAFDEVRVYDVDRLTRADDPRERFAVWGMVSDAGAIIVDRNGRETNPADSSGMGEIDYYLRTVFASQERKKIAERTIGGRKRNAAAGNKPSGATLYGFTYDKQTKQWGVHAERAAIVREMFNRVIAGRSVTEVARELTARGVPTPSGAPKWHRSRIYEIVKEPAYRGEKTYSVGSERFTCAVPRLVSDEVWHAAQKALSSRDRVPIRDSYKHEALLRKRGVCGECGSTMFVDASRGRPAYRQRYICSRKDKSQPCGGRSFAIGEVDELTWEAVCKALRDRGSLEAAIGKRKGSGAALRDWTAQLRQCRAKLATIQKQEVQLLRLLGQGLAESACQEQLQMLDRQRQTTQRTLELAEKALRDVAEEGAALASLEAGIEALRAKLDSRDFRVRDSVIAALKPTDGPLATFYADGRIDLAGLLPVATACQSELSAAARTGGCRRA